MLMISCRAEGDQTTRTGAVQPYRRAVLEAIRVPSHAAPPYPQRSLRAPWRWPASRPPRRSRRKRISARPSQFSKNPRIPGYHKASALGLERQLLGYVGDNIAPISARTPNAWSYEKRRGPGRNRLNSAREITPPEQWPPRPPPAVSPRSLPRMWWAIRA